MRLDAGQRIAAGVGQFPLFDVVVDDLALRLDAPFDAVAGEGVAAAQVEGGDEGGEAVAGVFEECAVAAHVHHFGDVAAAAAQVGLDVLQPVLALDVVGFRFPGVIRGGDEAVLVALVRGKAEGEAAEIALVLVHFLPVEEDGESL